MSNHRISGLADPTDADDAVTRRYVASQFQALSDEVQDKKSKLDALQNLLGDENNQVLIRKYEIISADYSVRGRILSTFLFSKYPPVDINTYEFIDMFMLKEYFFFIYLKNLLTTLHG